MIDQIVQKHGWDAMREVWIEELLELATILQQSKRNHKIQSVDIIDEIADVDFCLEQMKWRYGHDQIKLAVDHKKERTKKRLNL